MLHIKSFTFNPVQENTYILYNDAKDCCIIDPGTYFSAEEEELTGFVTANGLKPRLLLNTHCHFDHIFGNRFIHQTYGLELHLHPLEKPVLDYGPTSAQRWQLNLTNYDGPLHYIEAGDVVKVGDDELHVLFTPGHAPGHVCFYCPADSFVIGGDVLFNGSIGRTDLPMADFATLEKSIRTQLYTLPDAVTVYPGHGPATTIGQEKRTNPFVGEN